MELSFSPIALLQQVENSPEFLVIWSAFGTILLLLPLSILAMALKKVGFSEKYIKTPMTILTITVFLSWIIGFVSQILLFFSEVGGLHMLMIWVVMFLTILMFVMVQAKPLQKVGAKISEAKK